MIQLERKKNYFYNNNIQKNQIIAPNNASKCSSRTSMFNFSAYVYSKILGLILCVIIRHSSFNINIVILKIKNTKRAYLIYIL